MTDIDRLYEYMRALGVEPKRLLRGEEMARHTTFRIGGEADLMLCASGGAEIAGALSAARELGLPAMIMGNGSNLLVRDGGIAGLTIQIGPAMSGLEFAGTRVRAQAGCLMSRVSAECQRRGLSGFEALGGIPGSLGGAAAMNAGAYGSELKDVLVSATVLDGAGAERTLGRDELEMGYRTSRVLREGWTVTAVELELNEGDAGEIRARAEEFAARRREKQPLSLPSAGSAFKRPEGHFAGALIEQCGLKGTRVGGAQVSWLHAGFIVNAGGATARDVLDLIELIQLKVRMSAGVELEPEVSVVGREAARRGRG